MNKLEPKEVIAHTVLSQPLAIEKFTQAAWKALEKSDVFRYAIRMEVDRYFAELFEVCECRSVDEELSQKVLSRRNAVVSLLQKELVRKVELK